MIIIKEKSLKEARFRYNAVKALQVSGTKVKITVEVDMAKGIKDIAGYDIHRYTISPSQLNPGYLGEVIAHQLDWKAFALAVNDDHELSTLLSDLND